MTQMLTLICANRGQGICGLNFPVRVRSGSKKRLKIFENFVLQFPKKQVKGYLRQVNYKHYLGKIRVIRAMRG
jgi:hypothetical protein